MSDTISVNEPATLYELSAVKRANRGLLLFTLLAGVVFSLIFTEFGMSEPVAFCLDAVLTLIALQYLLRGTLNSPLEVLKHYREVNLLAALYATVLLFMIGTGIPTFASAFLPKLYSVLTLSEPTINSTWEMVVLFFGFAVLAPFYEELVFRGLALGAYRDVRSTLFAVLFTSVLFGFVHGSVVQTLFIFPMGIVFALVMLKTGQLWTVIVAHGLYNFTLGLLSELRVPEPPATPTFGILGLVVAIAAFWVAIRWLGWPRDSNRQGEYAEKGNRSIWTTSLVVVVIIAALLNLLTTYIALGPGVESIL